MYWLQVRQPDAICQEAAKEDAVIHLGYEAASRPYAIAARHTCALSITSLRGLQAAALVTMQSCSLLNTQEPHLAAC